MPDDQSKAKFRVSRLLNSTAVWFVVALIGADCLFRATRVETRVDETPLVKNIQNAIADKSLNPDVLVIGSSLSYCFTYDVSKDEVPEAGGVERPLNCAPSPFMTELIQKTTGKSKVIEVMALPGAMAGEIANIVQTAFTAGKRPKAVVYLAAPRDFVDRLNAPKKVSLLFAQPKPNAQPSMSERINAWVSAHVPAAMIRRIETFCSKPSVAVGYELALDSVSQLYENRSQVRSIVVDWTCDVFNRDKDLWSASRNQRALAKAMTHFDKDLGDYSMRYNPPDFERLKTEGNSLARLSEACNANACKLIVVNMPLTRENKHLLDQKLYGNYKELLATTSKADGFTVFDCDQFAFNRPEFIDSAHLNTKGSKRLQQLLAPQLAASLSQTQTASLSRKPL